MKKIKYFSVLWNYLKNDKLKLLVYVLLVFCSYIPIILGLYFWGKALEVLVLKNYSQFLIYLGLWEGICILCYAIVPIPRDKIYNYLEIKFMRNVSIDLYDKIQSLPAIAFEEKEEGEFINRLYNDTDRVMTLLNSLIKLSCKAINAFIILGLSFYVSWILGMEILIFCVVMGMISYRFFPKIKKTQEKIKKESDEYVKSATENITGIREIKALGIESNMKHGILNRLTFIFKEEKKIRNYEIIYYAFNNIYYFILSFLLFATAGYFFYIGNIAYGIFTMFDSLIWRLDELVESISDFGVNYNKVVVSLKRIDEIVNNRLYKDVKYGKKELSKIKGEIEFQNVSFRYKEDENATLKDLSLKIVPHKKIAIVGRSGNGKSTIFNLLLRFFDFKEGSIKIDGVNIQDLSKKSLRKNISIIRQNPFLFNLSIFDNFKLVKEDVTLEEIRKVCKLAYIDSYIQSLPKKYDTIIGEGGINLSGGQKQRIAIARTLLLDTKIILFDEATSALDNISQDYIKKTMDKLLKDHTVIIVAHRLSTIQDADQIHVIHAGKLECSGTHEELLKSSKVYQELYQIDIQNEEM